MPAGNSGGKRKRRKKKANNCLPAKLSFKNLPFKRMKHSIECVPETQIQDEICQSDGCPTVSPGFLKQIRLIIDKSIQPILLWIYQ